jgi:hypothetical protein
MDVFPLFRVCSCQLRSAPYLPFRAVLTLRDGSQPMVTLCYGRFRRRMGRLPTTIQASTLRPLKNQGILTLVGHAEGFQLQILASQAACKLHFFQNPTNGL